MPTKSVSAIDLHAYTAAIPEIDSFPTVDELNLHAEQLAAEFPQLARLRRVGTSRLGEPIRMLSIGAADELPNALVVAGAHCTELVGFGTGRYLSRLLCEDDALRGQLGFAWHFILCADQDGARLCERWLRGPYTYRNLLENAYKVPQHEDPEHTFPLSYKRAYFDRVPRETQAIARAIDELQPALHVSLHNTGMPVGGVFYYLNREAPELYETLQELPAWEGLSLDPGEVEAAMMVPVAPGIFRFPLPQEMYEMVERMGGDPSELHATAGASSIQYSGQRGAFGLVPESPMLLDARGASQEPSGLTRRDAIVTAYSRVREACEETDASYRAVEHDVHADSAYTRSLVSLLRFIGRHSELLVQRADAMEELRAPATQAEVFSANSMSHFIRAGLLGGTVVRMLEGEMAIGNQRLAIRAALEPARARFEDWADEASDYIDLSPHPLRKMVAMQLGATLAAADYVRTR